MAKRRFQGAYEQVSGFTLIEIVLVLAISSALLLIAFAGQRGLRSRAQFDAAVNKVASTVADANTQASAGVNIVGSGDGTNKCAGAPNGQYVFAGIAWTADNSLSPAPIRYDYYKVGPVTVAGPDPGVEACIFDFKSPSLPTDLTVTTGGRLLLLRSNNGSLDVCQSTIPAADPKPSFEAGGCVAPFTRGTLTLVFGDADGHTSRIEIEQSGLARRRN